MRMALQRHSNGRKLNHWKQTVGNWITGSNCFQKLGWPDFAAQTVGSRNTGSNPIAKWGWHDGATQTVGSQMESNHRDDSANHRKQSHSKKIKIALRRNSNRRKSKHYKPSNSKSWGWYNGHHSNCRKSNHWKHTVSKSEDGMTVPLPLKEVETLEAIPAWQGHSNWRKSIEVKSTGAIAFQKEEGMTVPLKL